MSSGILQRLLQGGKSGGSFVLFDRIVAVPSGNLLSGDNSELSKGDYPKGYKKVEEYLAGADKGNKFIGGHNIDTAFDYCIVNDTEYILTSDNKVKRWGIINSETEEEGWIPIETFNRVGVKFVILVKKIIFLYNDGDYDSDEGIAILDTTTNTVTKVALFRSAGYSWIVYRDALFLTGEYISFANNTAIPVDNLIADALVITTKQAHAYWKSKYWSTGTDKMNLFVSSTITGEYSSVSGIERPQYLLPISGNELFIHCSNFGNHKNYVYDEITFVEKTAKAMEVVCQNGGYIFGFDGTKVLFSSDKGATWTEQDLSVEVKSIGYSVDTESITITTANALYFKVYDITSYTDTITLTDESTVSISYFKNGTIKICNAEEQTNLNTVFADKGVLEYFIFDSENKYFKIPRANLPEAFSSIGLQKCWYIN